MLTTMTMTRSHYAESSGMPENWACVDCGINTAPGIPSRERVEKTLAADWSNKGIKATICENSEVYTVKTPVWKAANLEDWGGCLCIGCLEKRSGRILTPKDFDRKHPFSQFSGTKRLLSRRDAEWTPATVLFAA
jgi:hypothetical protein